MSTTSVSNSGNRERDEAILDHLAVHRLSLRRVLDRAFFAQVPSGCGNVIDRLVRDGFVQSRPDLRGRLCYYQLTLQGTAGRCPAGRARPLKSGPCRKWLAVLWFCWMVDGPRKLLERAELRGLFAGASDAPHCLAREDKYRTYQLWTPNPRVQLTSVVAELRQRVRRLRADEQLRRAALDGEYRLAVLLEPGRAAMIKPRVKAAELDEYVRVQPIAGLELMGHELPAR